jgi:hypothetical protein
LAERYLDEILKQAGTLLRHSPGVKACSSPGWAGKEKGRVSCSPHPGAQGAFQMDINGKQINPL